MAPEPPDGYRPDITSILAQVNDNQVETYQADGRKKIEELYISYLNLLKNKEWEVEKVADSKTTWHGQAVSYPILAFTTKIKGSATYVLSGIHGEEPTGPNAIAESIDTLSEMGQKKSIVLIPLCNPLGYLRNWRYLNKKEYTDLPGSVGMSVGDSEHYLIDPKDKTKARAEKPANAECAALSNYILQVSRDYPPTMSLDFHGDVLVPKGYIYSIGKDGEKDTVASQILKILETNGIPIQWEGKTRFGEDIVNGKVGPQEDGSIDELISARKIIIDGKIVPGPGAARAFVLETPDADIALDKRVDAYKAVISFLNGY
ncbi:MAG: succinylglutamate desuccinylase/aspartoacylase family protein [Nanoarchaeota archaeon]|nr:succinylglutamate desuccinylase/aspartoacylase family protein [Nanoarchaeota archaeon]